MEERDDARHFKMKGYVFTIHIESGSNRVNVCQTSTISIISLIEIGLLVDSFCAISSPGLVPQFTFGFILNCLESK